MATKMELEEELAELKAKLAEGGDVTPVADVDVDHTKGTIYEIIPKIKAAIGAVKKEKSQGLNYPFRGIDGVVNAVASALVKYGVTTVPSVVIHELTAEQVGQKVPHRVTVTVSYRFYASDGTFIEATVPGESLDYADKGTAQAMSVAYRIALLQTFTLPTDDLDPELSKASVDANPEATQTRAQVGIDKARQGGNTLPNASSQVTSAAQLQGEIKSLAGTLGHSMMQINEFARDASGEQDDKIWFNNVGMLVTIRDAYKAKIAEASKQ